MGAEKVNTLVGVGCAAAGIATLATLALAYKSFAELHHTETIFLAQMGRFKLETDDLWKDLLVVHRKASTASKLHRSTDATVEASNGQNSDRQKRQVFQRRCQCRAVNSCPPGPPGPPGNPGMDGMPGMPGDTGRGGQDGRLGPLPLDGQGCRMCPAGRPGLPGPPGNPGSRGPKGRSGINQVSQQRPTVRGPPGPPGDVGLPGLPGSPGFVGPAGQNGRSGKGPRGLPGRNGNPGAAGPPGPGGNNAAGFGPPGPPGPPGLVGDPGRSGGDGRPGEAGNPGQPGSDSLYCPCPERNNFVVNDTRVGIGSRTRHREQGEVEFVSRTRPFLAQPTAAGAGPDGVDNPDRSFISYPQVDTDEDFETAPPAPQPRYSTEGWSQLDFGGVSNYRSGGQSTPGVDPNKFLSNPAGFADFVRLAQRRAADSVQIDGAGRSQVVPEPLEKVEEGSDRKYENEDDYFTLTSKPNKNRRRAPASSSLHRSFPGTLRLTFS